MKTLKMFGGASVCFGFLIMLGAAGGSDFGSMDICETVKKIAEGFFFLALGGTVIDFCGFVAEKNISVKILEKLLFCQKRAKKQKLKNLKEKIYLT